MSEPFDPMLPELWRWAREELGVEACEQVQSACEKYTRTDDDGDRLDRSCICGLALDMLAVLTMLAEDDGA